MRSVPALLVLFLLTFPSFCDAQKWEIDPTPILRIGGLSEDPAYTLSNVVGGVRLDDGRVVVADRFTNGLRVYSSEGKWLLDVGREGEGPGEYEHIRALHRCNGSPIVAFDLHWDMKVYDLELNLLEEGASELPGLVRSPYRFDCNESGHWIATGWGDIRGQFKPGYFTATAPVVLGFGDQVLAEFGERLSSERIGVLRDDGGPGGIGPHPFGRETKVAIGPERVYLGDASGYEIEVFDLQGNPLPQITWSGPDRQITRRYREAYASELLEGESAQRVPSVRRWLNSLSEIKEFPAYDQLRVDQTGNLWVRYFHRPGEDTAQWVVFDPEGGLIGELTLPQATTLLDMGRDYVLLVEKDLMDVESVLLLRLWRSP